MKKGIVICGLGVLLGTGILLSTLTQREAYFLEKHREQMIEEDGTAAIKVIYMPKKLQGIHCIKERDENTQYSVYTYKGDVEVSIQGEIMSLEHALDTKQITMDEILRKAEADKSKGIASGDVYKDGGSRAYQYASYSILKCNTLEGNQDVYIGSADMDINDFAIERHMKKFKGMQ